MGRILLDLLSKLGHEHPQMLGLTGRTGSPDSLQDRSVGKHSISATSQQRQQLELLRREPDFFGTALYPVPVVVDDQIPSLQATGRRRVVGK
jgi:hypothetical protein